MKLSRLSVRTLTLRWLSAGVFVLQLVSSAAGAEEASLDVPLPGRLPEAGEVLRNIEIPGATREPLASRWYHASMEDRGYESTRVRPLDDPANPYRGQYEDWDRWFYGNYFAPNWTEPDFEPLKQARIKEQGGKSDQWRDYHSFVSADGWLIPQRQTWRKQTQLPAGATLASSSGGFFPEIGDELLFRYRSAGCMPVAMAERRSHEEALAMAPDYPPIPGWLGGNPPQEALMTLEGDWLCLGPLGGQVSAADWPEAPGVWYEATRREPCFLYDKDGKLLIRAMQIGVPRGPGGFAALYGNQELAMQLNFVSGRRDSNDANIYGIWWTGRGIFPDAGKSPREPIKLQWARDYHGADIDLNAPLRPYHATLCMPISAEQLGLLYRAQLELGLTSASASPHSGTAEGPVTAVNSDPQPRTRWAIASSTPPFRGALEYDARPVLAHDSAGNPYAGQYQEIDDWLWQHEGWPDPANFNIVLDLRGRPIDKNSSENGETWQQLRTRVDAKGYPLPLALALTLEHEALYGAGTRQAEAEARLAGTSFMHSGGTLSPELQKTLRSEIWPALAAYYPRIPDWLGQNPVGKALILPSGEVVTYGELGSWRELLKPEAENLLLPWQSNDGVFHNWPATPQQTSSCRYSADGRLLGSFPSASMMMDMPPWQALFEPGLAQVAQDARTLGMRVFSRGQYLAIQDVAGSREASYYDLNGVPLNASQFERSQQQRFLDWPVIHVLWEFQKQP
ncbi:hypothetical protein IT575_00890 [bacterium]|nr:hypothetical protein [bacterium]